jgi:hypothetical protein
MLMVVSAPGDETNIDQRHAGRYGSALAAGAERQQHRPEKRRIVANP